MTFFAKESHWKEGYQWAATTLFGSETNGFLPVGYN